MLTDSTSLLQQVVESLYWWMKLCDICFASVLFNAHSEVPLSPPLKLFLPSAQRE